MKIFLAQQNYHIGNFEENTRKIVAAIGRAKEAGADLVVFSELCVCGYPPRDFLEFSDFIDKCYASVDAIKAHADTIGVIIGAPARNPRPEGKDLFNAAWFLYEKEVKAVSHKTLLPTYDVFDEYRYFEPAFHWQCFDFKGIHIALTICEDIWNLGDNPLYRICPMDHLILQEPQLMVNISASPFDYDHDADRREVVHQNVRKYGLPMVYCNAVGSQTEIVFDGGSLVYDAKGNLLQEMKYFEEDEFLAELDLQKKGSAAEVDSAAHLDMFDKEMRVSKVEDPEQVIEYLTREDNIAQIHRALVMGIGDYFRKMGFTKAILGSSGGIDSAVTLALA